MRAATCWSFWPGLPELMVFNDEAHHIHEFKREGETTEVEWQKSLSRIAATKGRRFVQVDFSATPYNDVGAARTSARCTSRTSWWTLT
jgi:type III restriction enzyme